MISVCTPGWGYSVLVRAWAVPIGYNVLTIRTHRPITPSIK